MLTSPVVTVSFSSVLCSYLTNASCAPRARARRVRIGVSQPPEKISGLWVRVTQNFDVSDPTEAGASPQSQ